MKNPIGHIRQVGMSLLYLLVPVPIFSIILKISVLAMYANIIAPCYLAIFSVLSFWLEHTEKNEKVSLKRNQQHLKVLIQQLGWSVNGAMVKDKQIKVDFQERNYRELLNTKQATEWIVIFLSALAIILQVFYFINS